MNVDFYGLLMIWTDWTIFAYWPIWLVPIYLLFRRKKIKKKWLFLFASVIFCLVVDYLLTFFFWEVLLSRGGASFEKFIQDHMLLIDSVLYLIGVFIPFAIMHMASKLSIFDNRISVKP